MKLLRKLKDESGQAMILTLLSMTVLIGFVGFATDVGLLFHAKRNMQIAADSAAIAGAAELGYTDITTAGQDAAAQNGVTNGVNGVVAINNGPLYGPHAGSAAYVEAIVSQPQHTFFIGPFATLFGGTSSSLNSMTVTARAVATLGSSQGCVYTLGSSGADIDITGNATISLPNCGILDNSSSNNAMDLTGNVSVTAQSIGIVGNASDTGNITVSPTPVTGINPVGNPLASLPSPTVPPSCTGSFSETGNWTGTISSGCYTSFNATGNVNVTLNPGVYIIDGTFGGFTGNVTVTGTGVTFYLLGSSNLTGNVAMNLSAPTSGTYNGILFYQPSSNTNAFSLTGNAGSTLKGIVYAPSANVTFTGNSGSNVYTDFVVGSLTLTGNAGFNDYAAIAGNNTPLTSPRLVE